MYEHYAVLTLIAEFIKHAGSQIPKITTIFGQLCDHSISRMNNNGHLFLKQLVPCAQHFLTVHWRRTRRKWWGLLLGDATLSTLSIRVEFEEGRFGLFDVSRPKHDKETWHHNRFYGTCPSLNSTRMDGFVLNVKNGWCTVSLHNSWLHIYCLNFVQKGF